MSEVCFEKVEKSFGEQVAVRGVESFGAAGRIRDAARPSGCGKTTCLRMIAGFLAPSSGRIIMGGRDITALPPYRRKPAWYFSPMRCFRIAPSPTT